MMLMKKIAFFLLLNGVLLGLMASSCSQQPVPESEPDPKEDQTQQEEEKKEEEKTDPTPTGPQPGTYHFVASPMKGSWSAGDQIYVHGNIGTQIQTITLTAADISSDGKTASAQLSMVTESPADPDGLYAAWPAEAVKQYKGVLKAKTTFEDCDRLLTISYLEGDTFNFVDVSSMLSFTVTGDYNQYALVANNFDGLTYTSLEVEYSSEKTKYTAKNNGDPYKFGKLESGKPVQLWMPGKVSIKGFTLYVGKDGQWPLAYSQSETLSLKAAEKKD